MSENTFDPQVSNANLAAAQYYIDDDGSLKFVSPYLSSSNFDGTIPVVEETITAENILPGMLLQVQTGEYLPVVSVAYDDTDLEASPNTTITVNYIDNNNELNSIDYDFTDSVDVRYEDWVNKDLGNQGWTITSGGNAIFANVGVRGRIEATEGEFSGNLLVSGSISTADGVGGVGIPGIILTDNGFFAYNSSGTQTFSINADTGAVTIGSATADQLATDSELSSGLSGKINTGGAASDVNSNVTTISGGKIRTGSIESTTYSYTSGLYSNNGMQINLDTTGYIRSPNFYLDTSGNAYFRGTINAYSGFFGSSTNNWSIGEETVSGTLTAYMKSGTLKLYTQNISGVQHGQITLYNVDSTTYAGSLSNALSNTNKTIRSLGTGLHIGTVDDYLFIPGIGNTTVTRSRFRGSALDFYNTSDLFRIRLNNSGLNIGSDAVINFFDTAENVGAYIDYAAASDTLLIDNGGAAGGVVNVRASDLQLNGVSVAGGGGGGGGVTSFKFGDTGLTETGAVVITGAEIITAINDSSITNVKLLNRGLTIGTTTRNLGGTFTTGDIDGDVLTANSVAPGKIANTLNLFSIGGTGVVRGAAISTITGPLTIGNPATGNALTVNGGLNNGLSVPTARGLDYIMNFGTSLVNLNRTSTAMTLTGVTVDGLSLNTALFTLGSTAITAGNTVANYGLNYSWYLGTTAISLGRANAAATLTGITLSGAKITTPPTGTTSQNFLRWNSGTNDITQTSSNTAPSSIRFKEIIQRNPFLETSWIDEIEIVTFKYNQEKEWYGDNAPERLGLIAEEIENIPSINKTVEYNNVSGLAEGIDYDKIALLLIPEIKLLRQRVTELEARLDAAGL